jgi:hypothetical protein
MRGGRQAIQLGSLGIFCGSYHNLDHRVDVLLLQGTTFCSMLGCPLAGSNSTTA